MQIKKSKLDYKWVVLAMCFLMEFLCLGFCSSNAGLFTGAVTEALEMKRSVYSLARSVMYVARVIVALYFGPMVKRFGLKKMSCAGMLSMMASVIVRAYAVNFVHLCIGNALWGMGIVFSGGTMASTIVRRWFHQDVGKYTGIVMSANGIGGAIAAQIISPIINSGAFGYRNAYLLSAAVTLAITIAIMIFLREQPAGEPIAYEKAKKKPRGASWVGMDYDTVKKKPYFYLAAVMVVLTGISTQSVGSISIVYMEDIGMSPAFVATVATVSSLVLTVAKILTGHAYDKRGLSFAMLLCEITAIVGFVLKAILTNSTTGMVLAMVATVLTTMAMPLETVMIPLLSNDLFGSASYYKVLGIFSSMNALGLCLGTPIGDLYFDLFGTYRHCFWIFGGMLIVVAISFQFIIRAANKDKEKILAAEKLQG